jgi:ABC-type glutathione transport system ATPase component
MGEVERLCDRVIMMKRGKIEDDDTPARLLARYGRRTSKKCFSTSRAARGAAKRGSRRMSAATSPSFSFSRVFAMVMRHWYLLRSSWPRLLELIYWPLVQMLMWGFLQSFMAKQTGALATCSP